MGFSGKKRQKKIEPGLKDHWLVFFVENQKANLIDKLGLTRPGFRHCLAVKYDTHHEMFVMVDYNFSAMEIMLTDSFGLHHLFEWAEANDGTVVNFPIQRVALSEKNVRIGPTSCVKVILHALKIRQRFIYTPYQLYKFIMNNGGNIVREPNG